MNQGLTPPALRSRMYAARNDLDAETRVAAPPLTPLGVTYTMAQEATWVDDEHFAVGRWDGSLEIFSFSDSASQGPLINCAVNAPAQEGVQMVVSLSEESFASSNDEASIAIWRKPPNLDWSKAANTELLRYDPT